MFSFKKFILLFSLFLFIFTIIISTSTKIIHNDIEHIGNFVYGKSLLESNITNYLTKDKKVSLSILEFDEQGQLFNRKQLNSVLSQIKSRGKNQKIYIFLHGWRHDANIEDSNLQGFKNFLEKERNKNRKVTGIYIGWRGRSIDINGLDLITFWDRKNASEDMGKGELLETLLRIEKIQKDTKSTLVLTAHSFGASIVFNLLQPILVQRFLEYEKRNGTKALQGYGDLLILYNPAIEATRAKGLINLIQNYQQKNKRSAFKNQKTPIFISISGDGDKATNYIFPFGRLFSTIFESYPSPSLENRKMDLITMGNYKGFRTHKIWAVSSMRKTKCQEFTNMNLTTYQDKEIYFKSSKIRIEHVKKYNPKNPYWFLYDETGTHNIVQNHNNLMNTHTMCLLSTILYNIEKNKK